jgi:hypothetical protein
MDACTTRLDPIAKVMSRNLDKRFNWTPDLVAFEMLDWKNNESDFQKLCDRVFDLINNRWIKDGHAIQEIVPLEELHDEVRRAADSFQEQKHVSLPMFVYFRLLYVYRNRIPMELIHFRRRRRGDQG